MPPPSRVLALARGVARACLDRSAAAASSSAGFGPRAGARPSWPHSSPPEALRSWRQRLTSPTPPRSLGTCAGARTSPSPPRRTSPSPPRTSPSPPRSLGYSQVRAFLASPKSRLASRDPKSMKVVSDGARLNPPPRGIEPPLTPWEAGRRNDPNFGKGGGGMSAFTPTSQLRKRKTYQKRCKFIMQTLEDEKMREIAASSAVVPFRPGDVVRVKVEVLENRRRANWFTGIVIARRNRGMGSSFTLRSVMANVPVERTFPLYAPTIKAMEIVERRKVRRAKLYYLRDKPLRYSRV